MSAIILVHLYRTRDDAIMLANYNAALLSTCLMVLLGVLVQVPVLGVSRASILLPFQVSAMTSSTFRGATSSSFQ